MSHQHVHIWVYEVLAERLEEFQELYGRDGSWAALFRGAPGYLGTELLSDCNQEGRYVTIDHWNSEEDFTRFRVKHAEDYERLDRLGDQLTISETVVGEFRSV